MLDRFIGFALELGDCLQFAMDMEATVMGIGNHWGHGQLFERLLLYDAQAPRFSAEAWWHKAVASLVWLI